MPIPAFIGMNQTGQSGATFNTVPYTITANGNFLIAYAANDSPQSVSDTNGNAWTKMIPGSPYTNAWWCLANATGSDTITFNYGTAQNFTYDFVMEYGPINPNPASQIDVLDWRSAATGVLNISDTFTTNYPNESLVVLGNAYGAQNPYTSTTGLTIRYNNGSLVGSPSGCVVGDRPAVTVGSYTESGSYPNSPFGIGFIYITLRSPGDAPIPIPVYRSNAGMKGQRVFSKVR
jgi:hypothetical protein